MQQHAVLWWGCILLQAHLKGVKVLRSFFTFLLLPPHFLSLSSFYQARAAPTPHRHKSSAFSSSSQGYSTSTLIIPKQTMLPRFSQHAFEEGKNLSLFLQMKKQSTKQGRSHLKWVQNPKAWFRRAHNLAQLVLQLGYWPSIPLLVPHCFSWTDNKCSCGYIQLIQFTDISK